MPHQQQARGVVRRSLHRIDQLGDGREIETLRPIGNEIAAIAVGDLVQSLAHAERGRGEDRVEANPGVPQMPADGARGAAALGVQRAIEVARDAAIISRLGVAQQRQPFHNIPGAAWFSR